MTRDKLVVLGLKYAALAEALGYVALEAFSHFERIDKPVEDVIVMFDGKRSLGKA